MEHLGAEATKGCFKGLKPHVEKKLWHKEDKVFPNEPFKKLSWNLRFPSMTNGVNLVPPNTAVDFLRRQPHPVLSKGASIVSLRSAAPQGGFCRVSSPRGAQGLLCSKQSGWEQGCAGATLQHSLRAGAGRKRYQQVGVTLGWFRPLSSKQSQQLLWRWQLSIHLKFCFAHSLPHPPTPQLHICYVCAWALQAELSPCSLGPGRFVEAELLELLLF